MSLLPHHQQLLDASAISKEVADARGYWSASKPAELNGCFTGAQKRAPGLVIPVHDAFGQQPFCQLRPDRPREKDGKPLKYETPASARMVLDVPRSTLPYLGHPGVTLWVTEGIRKADALASIGLRAIALLGVWSWRGTNEHGGKTMLPDWHEIALNDRKVVLCFDSDAYQNPNVHKAVDELGRVLERRGASLGFAYLPSDGGKVGVDDYLGAGHSRDDLVGRIETKWRALPSEDSGEPVAEVDGRRTAASHAEPRTVTEVVEVFERWLYLPDRLPLLAVLGAVAANRLDGDPIWLVLVGPPGGGKTEPLRAIEALPDVYPTATLTEAALLSGTSQREREKGAKGGLLRVIGAFGVIACKDFGSVLNMPRDQRAAVLAALREIYDGSWTRHVGTGGGRTLAWAGKVGLVAGCTPAIDSHHAVMSAMGERFVLIRLPKLDDDAQAEQARRALEHAGREEQMRRELSAAVAGLFAREPRKPRPMSDPESERLISLATLVVRARSAVERDGYTREILLVPDAEAPTRLAVVLSRLLAGLAALGVERSNAWEVVTKAGLDSIPALRHAALDRLLAAKDPLETADLAEALSHPTRTTERALEDLTAHGVITVKRGGRGRRNKWQISEWARRRCAEIATSPEMSGGSDNEDSTPPPPSFIPPTPMYDDISGELPQIPDGAGDLGYFTTPPEGPTKAEDPRVAERAAEIYGALTGKEDR